MEANPRFKTGAPRGNESPPSSQRNRGSTGRLGLEAVRGAHSGLFHWLATGREWTSGCVFGGVQVSDDPCVRV